MSQNFALVHRPFGIDHPYEPFFDERRPRDPSGGDLVALGIITRPGSMAESVRIEWSRNGRPQTAIHARALERGADEDRWLVELGVVEASDDVTYQIHGAAPGFDPLSTPEHRFITRRWHTASAVTSKTANDEERYGLIDSMGQSGPDLVFTGNAETNKLALRFVRSSGDRVASRMSDPRRFTATGQLLAPTAYGDSVSVTIRWQEEQGRVTTVELTAPLASDEVLAGFGERFDSLNQHGRSLDVAVYEQYKNQGNRTYLPIPWFLSNQGYGLLVGGSTTVVYDFGRTVPDRWRCLVDVPASEEMAFTWFSGQPDDVVREMTAITGRPEPLPLWAYGVWMSSNEWNTQARVEHEVAETIRHEIPSTVLVIEAWSDETTFYIWNGAGYAPRSGDDAPHLSDFSFPENGPWPDPRSMTDALRESGIRTVLWQIPALKYMGYPHPQHDADVGHALEHQFVFQNADGTPYRNPFFWFKDGYIPDFTSEAATEWWMSKRAYLLDEVGIDGFKTDGSEHLAGRGLRSSDGRRGDELVNAYPNLYVGAYHHFSNERRAGDAVTFSRAGHTGAGALPAHWAGDENSTWEAFQRSIIAGLTAGLSGVIFWGWDIAGFSDALPTAELYLRSTAMATFCPIMQYHSEYNPPGEPSRDRTPWNIAAHTGDERAISLFRHFSRIRMNLLPYIATEAEYAAEHGTPLMRPLLLDYPEDPICWGIDEQYLFGRSLLIAPVVQEGATTRTLYLPVGSWVDFWTGKTIDGNQWITVDAPWDTIPVFIKSDTVIPLRFGRSGKLGSDTGNGLSLTEGLFLWKAGTGSIAVESSE